MQRLFFEILCARAGGDLEYTERTICRELRVKAVFESFRTIKAK